jgi:phage FluMu protein Com
MNSLRNDGELRCDCGSLMARVTERGVELKCRRCKRVVVVERDRAGAWVPVDLHREVRAMR